MAVLLKENMDEVKNIMDEMDENSNERTKENYKKANKLCENIHEMIMYGLQMRKMLVRMSDRDPKGKQSIDFWGTKTGFRKGHILNDQQVRERNNGNKRLA